MIAVARHMNYKNKKKKAVVLLSGGLDSATTLFYALNKGYEVNCLIFDYGQRHNKEIKGAVKLAKFAKCLYQILKISLPWKGSSLLDSSFGIDLNVKNKKIPPTYVPARNIIFLSFAFSYAEAIKAESVFIGANAVDYSGYPDCRPEFYRAYSGMIKKGTKAGVEGNQIKIFTPLIRLTKAEIVKLAVKLKVPLEMTWSCYAGGDKPCGKCDSCFYRAKGFKEAKVIDRSLID